MQGKWLLGLCGLIFVGYGVACLIDPYLAANNASLTITNGDAFAEMAAMYGGLQTGFGLFCLLCAWRPALRHAGLLMLAFVVGGLALARGYGAFDADWMVGGYTWGALAFEAIVAALAALAVSR